MEQVDHFRASASWNREFPPRFQRKTTSPSIGPKPSLKIVVSSGPAQRAMGWPYVRRLETVVLIYPGQLVRGPSGVSDQSNFRTLLPMAPPPISNSLAVGGSPEVMNVGPVVRDDARRRTSSGSPWAQWTQSVLPCLKIAVRKGLHRHPSPACNSVSGETILARSPSGA